MTGIWHNNKRTIWEKSTPWHRKARTNFRLGMEKFNRKTHGLGILVMLMMGVILSVSIFQIISNYELQNQPTKFQRYEIIIGGCQPNCYLYE